MRRHIGVLSTALLSLGIIFPAAQAPAQESYRAPAQKPVPMLILPKPADKAEPQGSPEPARAPAAPEAATQQPAGQSDETQPHGKFLNRDTAKNRQDYEMGTDSPGVYIGKDEKTGETVMGHAPQKKPAQKQTQTPITVVPVIRGGGY
jgi:hypothetical protein